LDQTRNSYNKKAHKVNFSFIVLRLHFFWNVLGPKGGCASSRLDRGLKTRAGEAALAADFFTAFFPGHRKRHFFLYSFTIFSAFFPNIWPLAGPNIAKKGWPLQKLARVDRQTHFGTFDFWIKPGFPI